MNYTKIVPLKSFNIEDAFCDEDGNLDASLPVSKGSFVFTETADGTLVEMKTIYPSERELQTMVEMGFEQGIAICLDQLGRLFEQSKV